MGSRTKPRKQIKKYHDFYSLLSGHKSAIAFILIRILVFFSIKRYDTLVDTTATMVELIGHAAP